MNNFDTPPRISVILVVWNSSSYLAKCLDRLVAQINKDFEVIIVDNGSTDNGCLELEEKYPKLNLSIKRLEQNTGFAVANNMGAHLARGKYLALLNADAFPEPDWLERLLEAAEKYPNSFFSSRQIQADRPDFLDGEGDVYHVSGLAWRENYNFPVYPLDEYQEVFSACGAAALYPRQEFLDAGGFDRDFFAYLEDVDLGFRLRLRGLRCILVPQAVVYHVGSASSGKLSDFVVYHGHRNLVWTFFKDMPISLLLLYFPLHLLMNLYFMISFSFKSKSLRRAIWRAKLDAIRGLPVILKKRREVQLQRKASVAEIHRAMSRNWLTPFLTFIKRKSR